MRDTTTPYAQLQRALVDAGAQRLAVIDGPNKGKHPAASELEFWNVAAPKPGRLVIVQKWTRGPAGGFDYYTQGAEHKTADAIADVIGTATPTAAALDALEAAFTAMGREGANADTAHPLRAAWEGARAALQKAGRLS